jgi:predicted transcriptional regulator
MYSEVVQRWWDGMTPAQQEEYRSRTKMFTKIDGRTIGDLRAALGAERLAVMSDLPGLLRRLADPNRIRDKAIAEQNGCTDSLPEFASAKELARLSGRTVNSIEKKCARLRAKEGFVCFVREEEDRQQNEPKYLYRTSVFLPMLQK